jgi:hypothetical protein
VAREEVVRRHGRHEACALRGPDGQAPDGCGALLRVELVPLHLPVRSGACAPNDGECMTSRAQGGCGAGFVRKGDMCEPANPERPSLIEGLGGGKK